MAKMAFMNVSTDLVIYKFRGVNCASCISSLIDRLAGLPFAFIGVVAVKLVV